MKTEVAVHVNPSIPEPYQTYIRERNGHIGQDIARLLGIGYIGISPLVGESRYHVPATTVSAKDVALAAVIETENDFYGTLVEHPEHVQKAILYASVSANTPKFHSPAFARAVHDLVLPGFTAFNKSDAIEMQERFDKIKPVPMDVFDNGLEGNRNVTAYHKRDAYRIKLPGESDGNGQYVITDRRDMRAVLRKISDEEIAQSGIVVEPHLYNAKTVSVGFAVIGETQYSFVAFQKGDIDGNRNRYLGADVVVKRGTLEDLYDAIPRLAEKETRYDARQAVRIGVAFHDKYSYFAPVASRLSYDILSGTDVFGYKYAGVTDITGRLGGTCPAIMQAVQYLSRHPGESSVTAEVNLNYEPHYQMDYEEGATVYVDHPTLRLTAKLRE